MASIEDAVIRYAVRWDECSCRARGRRWVVVSMYGSKVSCSDTWSIAMENANRLAAADTAAVRKAVIG